MLYQQPFVIYLNICICVILLLLILPTLLNGREQLKIRVAFATIFLTVIINCITNVTVFYYENYKLIPIVFLQFFIPLLFGPCVLIYTKGILGYHVNKSILFSTIPSIVSFLYGINLIFSSHTIKEEVLQQIIQGNHYLFNITNLITLFYILFYCVKSWIFIKKLHIDERNILHQQIKLKEAWVKEFIAYIFGHIFIFFFIHSATVAKLIPISTLDLELVWMPIFMLFVYLLIAIRSTMMYKEFEHQFVLAKIETDRKIQEQRMEIARDLHDSLGAQLTLINTVTDSIKQELNIENPIIEENLARLSYFSDKSITELKNALWVLNASEISLEDLKIQLLNFVHKLEDTNPNIEVIYTFQIEQNLQLESKQAANLFRIVQEFINNTLKYAKNDKLWIEFTQKDMQLHMELKDNGIGFDANIVKPNTYGIANLRHRIKSMNGELQLYTNPGEGTTYIININLKS